MQASPRRRRVLRRVSYALAGLVALALLLLSLAHTSAAKRLASRVAVSLLRESVGGAFEVEALDYRLWRGEFHAAGIHWSSENGSISVQVESVTVLAKPGAAPAIAVQRPEVRLTLDDGDSDASSLSLPTWLFGLGLSVTEGSLFLSARSEEPWLELKSIDARLGNALEHWDGELAFESARIKRGGLDLGLGPARSRLALRAGGVVITELSIQADDARFTGSAHVSSFSPLALEANLAHTFGGPLVKELLPDINIEATLEGESTVSLDNGQWRGHGVLRSSALRYEPLAPLEFEAPWQFEGDVLRVDGASVAGYGGTAGVSAAFDLEADVQMVEASFEGLEPPFDTELVRSVSGSASVSFRDWDIGSGRGEGYLEPLPLRGRVQLRLEQGTLDFEARELEGPGFTLTASGEAGDTLRARFRANAPDLSRLDARLADLGVEGASRAEGTVVGPWDDLVALVDVSTDSFSIADIPLDLEGELRVTSSRVELQEISLRHRSGGWLKLQGRYDLDREVLALRGEGDGFELTDIPEATGRVSSLRFELQGPVTAIRGTASAHVESPRYRDVDLPNIGLEIEADGKGATLVARLPDSRELASARVASTAPYPTTAEARLENLPVGALTAMVPELVEAATQFEPRGSLRVEWTTLSEPTSLRYRVDVEQILGIYRGVGFGVSAPFSIEGNASALEVTDLILVGADTVIGVDGGVPLSREGQLDLHARGAARLELLNLWFPENEPAGRANLDLRIGGTLDEPTIAGELLLSDASARWNQIAIDGVELVSRVRDNVIAVEDLHGNVLGGRFRLQGEVPVGQDSRAARLRFRLDEIDPTHLAPEDGFGVDPGQLRISTSGELEGEPLAPSEWEGRGQIEQLIAREGTAEIELAGAGPWTLEPGRFRVSGLRLLSGGTELVLEGEVNPFVEPLAWGARASGQLDNALLAPTLLELGIVFTGTTTLDVHASQGEEPFTLGGTVTVSDGRLALREPALTFTNLNGALELERDLVTITRLDANVGGGTAEGQGQIRLEGTSIADLDLTGRARSVRLSYPADLRSEIDGQVQVLGTPPNLRITGDVTLARAIFSRNINLESELLQSVARVSVVEPSESIAGRTRLDIRVRSLEGLRVDNNLATMEASANLTVRGTLAEPELSGIVSARPQGEFRFGRNIYRIEAGRIQLQEYPIEPPELDFTARTTVGGYDIRLVVRGSTDELVTELTSPSHPDLSRADVASILFTGRPVEKLTTESRAILGEQMTSYLGATLGDLTELGLGRVLPFDLVTVQPSLITGEADPGARFTLGAALTESLSVVYSIGLDDAESQIWIVDYELPRRTRTQLIRQEDNEFTAALSQQLPFDFHRGPDRVQEQQTEVARVGFYFISGEPGDLEARSLDRIRLKEGHRYDYWKAWEEAERLREWLREEGFLKATVDLDPTTCGEGCVELDFYVVTGKTVRFVWEGDEPGDSLKKAFVGAWDGYLSDAFLASDLALLAEGRLFEQRYYLARAEIDVLDLGADVVVTTRLAHGPRGGRVAIDFTGNEALSDAALLAVLPRPTSAEFHELITSKQPRLEQILNIRYASQGYLHAEVGELARSFDGANGVLTLTVPIVEGPRSIVDRIELEGVEELDEALVRSRLALRVGAPFRVNEFVRDRTSLASFYRRQGFPDVEVDSAVLRDPDLGTLGAKFLVREGPRVAVGNIRVTGNDATRESVIRREIALEPGEPLRLAEVSKTQKQLYDLGIFRSAEIVVSEAGPDPARRDVVIEVAEAPDLRLDYGLRFTTDGLFEVFGELNAPNLFGRAHDGGFRTQIGTDQRIFRFAYGMPYFARYRLNTNFFVERSLVNEEEADARAFTAGSWTFTAQQGRALRERLRAQWSYTFKRSVTSFEPSDDDIFDPTIVAKRAILSGSLIGDRRDSVVRPKRGSLWNVTVQGAPEALGSDLKYLKLYGQLYTFVPLGHGVIWAAGYRAGVINSFGQRLRETDRFRAGGPNSVRGFELGSLGPIDELVPAKLGGSGILVFNQEIRFPIAWRLRGVGFYDAGNIYALASDIRLSDLRHSAGAGLRLELPFGLLRLDWAGVLDGQEDEDPWRFIFSLGHAF